MPEPSSPSDAAATVTSLDVRAPSRAANALPVASRLGGYIIEQMIATGGTACIYRARDERLGRSVALKVLIDDGVPTSRERFLREVQLVAGLVHPNIVTLYAAGEQDGLAFAAMELLPGSLADELRRRGRLPLGEAFRAARDACVGLDEAWKKGIVHRDVKPSNLLRDAGGVTKVADFGLAKDLSTALDLTAHGIVLGTPLYVSPEQGCGRAVDNRSDLYSLGATLFHLLTGRPPFDALTPFELIVRHAVTPPPPLGDEFPSSVSALVGRLLEKDPGRRPAGYQDVIDAIDGAWQDEPDAPRVAMPRRATTDALATSQIAAARAALEIGRTRRARDILDRLFRERGGAWVEAGLQLAPALERSGELESARAVLEAITREAPDADSRAMALWSLGKLAEKESEAALGRAIEAYAKVLEVSGTLFPKTLLEARIARLKAHTPGAGHDRTPRSHPPLLR